MGDPRLKVRKLRGWDHYCMPCAKIIVERDLANFNNLPDRFKQREVESGRSSANQSCRGFFGRWSGSL
jgi:hypothetical protein